MQNQRFESEFRFILLTKYLTSDGRRFKHTKRKESRTKQQENETVAHYAMKLKHTASNHVKIFSSSSRSYLASWETLTTSDSKVVDQSAILE